MFCSGWPTLPLRTCPEFALKQGEAIMSAFVHHASVHAHGHPARFSIGSLIVLGGALAMLSRLFGMA